MSCSLSSSSVASTIINQRSLSPSPMPNARFFRMPIAAKTHLLRLRSANCSHTSKLDSSGNGSNSLENQGSNGKDGESQAASSNEVLTKLKRYGISGILSYGLLNTAYYTTTFLVVWFYVAPAPGKLGYLAAVERFLKVMAMVWAGSQVTKILRAGG